MSRVYRFVIGIIVCLSLPVLGCAETLIDPWQVTAPTLKARHAQTVLQEKNVQAVTGQRLTADVVMLAAEMQASDHLDISLPLPDGTRAVYRFQRSLVMARELAEKYPMIHTFKARALDNPHNYGSFDLTEQGFHGMFFHNGQWVFIDPEIRHDHTHYLVYYAKDARAFDVAPTDKVIQQALTTPTFLNEQYGFSSRPVLGETLRTYRLAVSASAAYTEFHGGTVSAGLSAITTMVNRINEIFQRDLAVRFELVKNNDQVVFTRSNPGTFKDNDADITRNPVVLNKVIGDSNYDLGHVLNITQGGLAELAGVCKSTAKAKGLTGSKEPRGDAFYVDYVAHEIGHQLGANHTFNSCGGSGRNAETAWEPGSGSTIMGYAGICNTRDLQAHSESFFHTGSIEEMLSILKTKTCGTQSAISNEVPTVDAGDDFVIPANTPFKLTGSGLDADRDSLLYAWEEFDLGQEVFSASDMVDNGNRPLFRSWSLTTSSERTFPRMSDVLAKLGQTTIGESYPNTNRTLTFRLTARDNKGGVATDEMQVTVHKAAGPFKVTEPDRSSDWKQGEQVMIRWEVAGTDAAPINCSHVNISLSTDKGAHFNKVVAVRTDNDGEYAWVVGDDVGAYSRVMVSCLNNVFFAVNEGDFLLNAEREVVASAGKSGGGSAWWLSVLGVFLLWGRMYGLCWRGRLSNSLFRHESSNRICSPAR